MNTQGGAPQAEANALMIRRIRRSSSANRKVTVSLDGWPKEVRMLSVVDEYWSVELRFTKPNGSILTHVVFESDNYSKTFAKYEAFKQIVTD